MNVIKDSFHLIIILTHWFYYQNDLRPQRLIFPNRNPFDLSLSFHIHFNFGNGMGQLSTILLGWEAEGQIDSAQEAGPKKGNSALKSTTSAASLKKQSQQNWRLSCFGSEVATTVKLIPDPGMEDKLVDLYMDSWLPDYKDEKNLDLSLWGLVWSVAWGIWICTVIQISFYDGTMSPKFIYGLVRDLYN